MPPGFVSNDFPDSRFFDSKETGKAGQICAPFVKCANLAHLIFVKMRIWISNSGIVRMALAPLRKFVVRIVFISAKKQMRWITARRIIALMTNKKPSRNRAINQFVNHPMRSGLMTILGNNPVSGGSMRTLPEPALVICAPVYSIPKPFFERIGPSTMPGNKTHWQTFDISKSWICAQGKICFSTATAFAEFIFIHVFNYKSVIRSCQV